MKKINDSKLYLYFAIIAFSIGLLVGAVSFYSILHVEKKVKSLLEATTDIDKSYKQAYLILRDPQVFAGYENWDAEGARVQNSLVFFDGTINNGAILKVEDRVYLDILLERRMKGSRLGRTTMGFCFIMGIAGLLAFFYEKRQNA